LEEAGERLDVLTVGLDADNLTDRLKGQEGDAWKAYQDGVYRLTQYLSERHPETYADLVDHAADRYNERQYDYEVWLWEVLDQEVDEGPGGDGRKYVEDCLHAYHRHFDPAAVAADIARAEAELRELMDRWGTLPNLPVVQEEKNARLTELNTRIEELRAQSENVAEVVETAFREMLALRAAIASAMAAMEGASSERAYRQRAAKLRAVIQRIECRFVPTGLTGRGRGRRHTRLAEIVIYPVLGDAVHLSPAPSNTTAARGPPVWGTSFAMCTKPIQRRLTGWLADLTPCRSRVRRFSAFACWRSWGVEPSDASFWPSRAIWPTATSH
jgi:hypothetical protein